MTSAAPLPISFSPALLAAVRTGRKTTTRRRIPGCPALTEEPDCYHFRELGAGGAVFEERGTGRRLPPQACPFGLPGGRLRVVEAPGLVLAVEAVRVERVQAITAAGARAEGIQRRATASPARWGGVEPAPAGGFRWYSHPVTAFAHLLSTFYPTAWERNAWMWVVDFRVLKP